MHTYRFLAPISDLQRFCPQAAWLAFLTPLESVRRNG
jgi:cell division inhibitor SulA